MGLLEGRTVIVMIKRGDIVTYHGKQSERWKVISEPYLFQGKPVVTCQRVAKKKADRQQGLFTVDSLELCCETKER